MNAHARRVTRADQPLISLARPAKHHLGTLNTRVAQRLVVFTPTIADIETLMPQARAALGGGAATDVVHRVFRHNPDSFWAIARREEFATGGGGEGFVAYLMLNQAGVDSLFDGSFCATDPDLSLICRQSETPVGIYVWGIFARGIIAGGIPLTYEKVCIPRYHDIPLYARAVTPEGQRILENLGFVLGTTHKGRFASNVYAFQRGKAAPRLSAPLYDTYVPDNSSDTIGITVARTIEDFFRVMSVRSAVYVAEQQCPYAEEFDGNDLTGSHLLGYVGNEPVGSLRIRCFADFAKLERLAVRREFRELHLGTKLMQAGVEFCRAKGYRRIYGHAEKNILEYYEGMGWRQMEGSRRVIFSDYEYVEIVFDAVSLPNAVSLTSDPYIILRPEGRWHLPGVLERSALRPVARSSVEREAVRPARARCAEKTRERIRA